MLGVTNLSFGYQKGGDAISGVSFSLQGGEVGILLGKNGSGKSTLLKAIAGILKPREGSISLEGEDLKGLSPRERAKRIGYVPQSIEFGSLSVYDSVLVGRLSSFGFLSSEEDRSIVSSVLEEMGLSALSERNVEELSGGERQKVAIARALVIDPKLYLFDEPTGNLDIGNEHLILQEAKLLAKEKGAMVLLAIHDLSLALQYGDRFFLLKDGKLLQEADASSLDSASLSEAFDAPLRIHEIDGKRIVLLQGEKHHE